ncbi:hypothetical protein SNEBB_000172 [Seison nebaliae]|nr:hypothetical protein SNEBB_000172 [Seison nebaliae]
MKFYLTTFILFYLTCTSYHLLHAYSMDAFEFMGDDISGNVITCDNVNCPDKHVCDIMNLDGMPNCYPKYENFDACRSACQMKCKVAMENCEADCKDVYYCVDKEKETDAKIKTVEVMAKEAEKIDDEYDDEDEDGDVKGFF